MSAHPHAELIKQMVDDDSLRATCPELTGNFPAEDWDVHKVINWAGFKWRLVPPKPKTITIVANGKTYELPEPMRVAPEFGAEYYVWESTYVSLMTWNACVDDRRCLSNGRCHATREAAQQWVDAMSEIRGGK